MAASSSGACCSARFHPTSKVDYCDPTADD